MDNTKEIVIFGAGKIGRSFIGQLFGCSGYRVVFIDVDPVIIAKLNEKGSYRVVIKGDTDQEIIVPNVSAISSLDRDKVVDAVSKADILAVSVGKNVLERIVPVIAVGVEKRYATNSVPLDVILAENMRSAADFVRKHLLEYLPSDFPLEAMVGLIETSIGKMVPIIPQAELDKDPLVVFAEAYNTLIVDEKGFKLPVPQIKGLAPKSNIKAWVDRKAFIHNLGHATAAYYGYALHPNSLYLYEVLEDAEILLFTRAVMLQSAKILSVAYPGDFTFSELETHIDDLIYRFKNKALQDTIYRVGQDLIRKLGPDDRFMGAIHLAIQYHLDYNLVLEAMSYAFSFRATDDVGKCLTTDKDFLSHLFTDFESTLIEILGYDKVVDQAIIGALLKLHMKSGILN